MYSQIILAILIARYLRNTLKAADAAYDWDKKLVIAMIAAVALLVIETLSSRSRDYVALVVDALLIYLLYITFYKKVFAAAKPLVNGVLPLVAVLVAGNLARLINTSFYNSWDDTFEAAQFFAFIYMVAIWVNSRKQKKVLEKERLKAEEKEKEFKITETLKAALEVQVAERTAALTMQKEELEETLHELRSTQAQLIQSEKMASLGELTAGIAHEIQNPLNFVNNFSEVNSELIEELANEIEKGNFEEVKALAKDIAANEQKINHHGKRADAIVKGMLQHSRSSNAVKEPTDINALADEYLRLAYHGLRAKDKSFNATMKTDYDPAVGSINVIPQDMGRVILNLITNAFYAVFEKKKKVAAASEHGGPEQPYEPTVVVSTKKANGKVEIRVKDNGDGIPQKVLDKIFQPFFTTKPTGQGTGLGLSLSYDIIKAHGGELNVKTEEGRFAEFVILLSLDNVL